MPSSFESESNEYTVHMQDQTERRQKARRRSSFAAAIRIECGDGSSSVENFLQFHNSSSSCESFEGSSDMAQSADGAPILATQRGEEISDWELLQSIMNNSYEDPTAAKPTNASAIKAPNKKKRKKIKSKKTCKEGDEQLKPRRQPRRSSWHASSATPVYGETAQPLPRCDVSTNANSPDGANKWTERAQWSANYAESQGPYGLGDDQPMLVTGTDWVDEDSPTSNSGERQGSYDFGQLDLQDIDSEVHPSSNSRERQGSYDFGELIVDSQGDDRQVIPAEKGSSEAIHASSISAQPSGSDDGRQSAILSQDIIPSLPTPSSVKRTLMMIKHVQSGGGKAKRRSSWSASTVNVLQESPPEDAAGFPVQKVPPNVVAEVMSLLKTNADKVLRESERLAKNAAAVETALERNNSLSGYLETEPADPVEPVVEKPRRRQPHRSSWHAASPQQQPELSRQASNVSQLSQQSSQTFVLDLNNPNGKLLPGARRMNMRTKSSSTLSTANASRYCAQSSKTDTSGFKTKRGNKEESPVSSVIMVSSDAMPQYVNDETSNPEDLNVSVSYLQLTAYGDVTTSTKSAVF